jgi:hypothetical protein
MLTALSMSAAFAHLLEMPGKLKYDGGLWLTLLHTLYPTFGKVSGICEIGAVVAALVLVISVRKHSKTFRWALLGTSCLVVTHAVFWIWVAPVNAALVPLTSQPCQRIGNSCATSGSLRMLRARSFRLSRWLPSWFSFLRKLPHQTAPTATTHESEANPILVEARIHAPGAKAWTHRFKSHVKKQARRHHKQK